MPSSAINFSKLKVGDLFRYYGTLHNDPNETDPYALWVKMPPIPWDDGHSRPLNVWNLRTHKLWTFYPGTTVVVEND